MEVNSWMLNICIVVLGWLTCICKRKTQDLRNCALLFKIQTLKCYKNKQIKKNKDKKQTEILCNIYEGSTMSFSHFDEVKLEMDINPEVAVPAGGDMLTCILFHPISQQSM